MFRVLFVILLVMSSFVFAQTEKKPQAIKFDEFGKLSDEKLEMKIYNFYIELNNNPKTQAFIFNYGNNKDVSVRDSKIINFIKSGNYDISRISSENGFKNELKTEFWIVPSGAENPKLDPTAKLIAEFETTTPGFIKSLVDTTFIEINENPKAISYMVTYGTAREIAEREEYFKKAIMFRKYDINRIVFVRGGYQNKVRTMLWIVPEGAEKPKAEPMPILVDEFGKATNGNVKMRVNAFFVEMNKNPSATAYIITYGTPKQVAKREKQIRDAIRFRRYDSTRITFVNGGNLGNSEKTLFFLIPPGAESPTP